MDRQLRDLLEAAAGEPPHRISAEAVRRRVIRRRVVEFTVAAVAVAAIAALIPVGIGALGRAHRPPNSGPAVDRIVTSRSGFLVELAVTVRHGTGFVFASQNPTGTKPTDRADFRKFLTGIRLQR